jgi:hypothetical protein
MNNNKKKKVETRKKKRFSIVLLHLIKKKLVQYDSRTLADAYAEHAKTDHALFLEQ